MSESKLVLHRGEGQATRDELAKAPTPAATETWFPVGHDTWVGTVQAAPTQAGSEIRAMKFALARNDPGVLATTDLATPLAAGVSLAAGVRNSPDRSLPLFDEMLGIEPFVLTSSSDEGGRNAQAS